MDVESAQSGARPQLGAEVTTRRLLRCRAPKRTALETPDLGDRRGSRIGRPRFLGACARRSRFAVDPSLSHGDDVGARRRRGQRGRRRGIVAAGRAEEHDDQVIVLVGVGSLGRSELLRPALVHIGRARRLMRRRFRVVLCEVLVDGQMRHDPGGLGERCQQQSKGRPALPKNSHGRTRYPFSLHAPLRIGCLHLRLEDGTIPMYGLGLALLSALLFGAATRKRTSPGPGLFPYSSISRWWLPPSSVWRSSATSRSRPRPRGTMTSDGKIDRRRMPQRIATAGRRRRGRLRLQGRGPERPATTTSCSRPTAARSS